MGIERLITREDKDAYQALPGRNLRWILGPAQGAEQLSSCVVELAPGAVVRPAHSHPDSEELVYILEGEARVWIDGEVGALGKGAVVLFPKGLPHMLANASDRLPLRAVCVYAPPTELIAYVFHPELGFPEV